MTPKKRTHSEAAENQAKDNSNASGKREESIVNKSKSDGKDKKKKKEGPASKKMKNLCAVCSKRVGLTGITCRCGNLFCGYHRYSDRHNCPFDYHALGKKEIKKNNPRIVGKKIDKI